MTKLTKIEKEVKAVREVVAGNWVRFMGDWVSDCFNGAFFRENPGEEGLHITITKDGSHWFPFTSDHEPEELIALDGESPTGGGLINRNHIYTSKGFRTLRDACEWSESFGEWFQELWEENNISEEA